MNGEAGNLEVVTFYNDYSNFIKDASIGTEFGGEPNPLMHTPIC